MPVSIPAYLALRFVRKENLRTRIRVLQKSYKIQVAGLTMFSIANFDKATVVKPLISTLAL